jgi:hypothetical protein
MAGFTPEQRDKLMKTSQEILHSKFVDPANPPSREEKIKGFTKGRGIPEYYKPGAFDVSKPEVRFGGMWQSYITHAAIHDRPSNKKGTKHFNTTKERSAAAKELANYLRRTPTSADLKEAFPTLTQLDDELCEAIDRDLESLLRR